MFKKNQFCQRVLHAAGTGLVLLSFTILPIYAAADDDHAVDSSTEAVQSTDQITVVRDADTGKLRAPTAQEYATLHEKSAKHNARIAPAATLQKFHFTGARGARLTDEFTSAVVAVRAADGGIVQQCFDSRDAAEAAVSTAGNVAIKVETE